MLSAFSKCPKCGLLADKRTSCTCGHVAPPAPSAPTPSKPRTMAAPPSPSKPGLLKRAVAVLLVVPIAFCLVAVVKW